MEMEGAVGGGGGRKDWQGPLEDFVDSNLTPNDREPDCGLEC